MSTDKRTECRFCGKSFDTHKGVRHHETRGHSKPYQDEETLREEYVEKGKSTIELADKWDCDSTTISNWLDEFGIETRSVKHYNRVEYVNYSQHEQGYEIWKPSYGEDRGKTIFVHRLAAVAWFGVDAVKDKVVHHQKPIPWVNTEHNIELKEESEHAREHYQQGDLELEPGGIREAVSELKNEL